MKGWEEWFWRPWQQEKPVVATRVGGLTELVEDQVSGYLISPGDVDALVKRLKTLITDPDLRQKMGQAGTHRVGQKHSAETMVEMIHQVYQRHLAPENTSTVAPRATPALAGEPGLERQESSLAGRVK